MRKWGIMLVFICLLCIVGMPKVQAAADLYVEAEAGIDNKAKYSLGLPLQLTVTNNGDDFSGDLILNISQFYNAGNGRVIKFDIASGETKTLHVYLDGFSDQYNSGSTPPQMFYFYEGDWKDGDIVPFEGDKSVIPQFYSPDTYMIFTLTKEADRLNGLYQLNQQSTTTVEIFPLQDVHNFTFPSDVRGLQMANALLIDEVSITDLEETQQQALLSWVRQGGTVVFGNHPQGDVAAGVLQPYLPLAVTDETATISTKVFDKLSTTPFKDEPLTIHYGQLQEQAQSVLASEGQVVIAERAVGSGKIIQTTFSIGAAPFATAEGFDDVLSAMLKPSAITLTNPASVGQGLHNSSIVSLNELFPSFEVSVSKIVLIILLYIIMIGPVLYIILKRADRREQAWWIIPTVAIIVSVGIFVVSAKDRIMQPQMQQSAVYKVNEDGSASGQYVQALLTNRAGDFTFETDSNTTINAVGSPGNLSEIYKHAIVEESISNSTMTLRNMNYWSTQTVMGQTQLQQIGSFDYDLTFKDGVVSGTVTNNFDVTMQDVALLVGLNQYTVGTFAPGETKDVNEKVSEKILTAPYMNQNAYYDAESSEEVVQYRREALIDYARQLAQDDKKPILVGWSDVATVPLTLAGNSEQDAINVFSQSVSIEQLATETTQLQSKDMIANVYSGHSNSWYELIDPAKQLYYLEQGTFDVVYTFPEIADDMTWKNLVMTDIPKELQVKVYNHEKGMSEEIDETFTVEDLTPYMSDHSTIQFEVTLEESTQSEYTLPQFSVEGVLNND